MPGSWLTAAIALGIAWAMKQFYSHANFDELAWVLAPTMRLVERAGGVVFELEPHHGYLSRDHWFEVVPACAGLNFMIVTFVSLCLGLAHTCPGAAARAGLVLGSALAAYAGTVLANATRIVLAIRLHDAGASFGALTPERLHCALGVAVYFLFLLVLFTAGERLTGARRELAR